MPLYDLFLLLDPGAPSERQDSILADVQKTLESGGTVVGAHDWGSRRMAFEIDHRPDAAYHLYQFETEEGGALLERVDHSLKIMDGVLRHRIIRLKDGSPPPPNPRPEGRPYESEGAPEGVAAEGVPAEAGAPIAEAAPTAAGEAAAGAPAEAAPAEAPAAAEVASSDAVAPSADPATDPAAADEAPAVPDPVDTAAPDASSLPAEEQAPAEEPAAAEGEEPTPAA